MEHINMEKFAGGELSAQINRALQKIAENIADPRMDVKKPRKISVQIGFVPNKNRSYVVTGIETKVTLAPENLAVTTLGIGGSPAGDRVCFMELGDQIPGQMSIADYQEDQVD